MGTTGREYVLTPNLLKVFTTKGYPLICEKCSQPFKLGDRIISRHDHTRTKRYHKKCWLSLYGIFYQPKAIGMNGRRMWGRNGS